LVVATASFLPHVVIPTRDGERSEGGALRNLLF